MKKSIVVSLHVMYWFFYVVFVLYQYVMMVAQDQDPLFRSKQNTNTMIALVTSVFCFYVFYLFLVPRFLATRRIKTFVWSGLGVAFGIMLCRFAIQGIVDGSKLNASPDGIAGNEFMLVGIQVALVLVLGTGMVLLNGLLATLLRGFITWYHEIHLKEVLTSRNVQTELSLVRAQINPHFLFNTLNNIDILIEKNADAASSYLKKLSGMMRFVLYETREERIRLTQEIEYIEKYLDLQSIRTENKDFVSFEVSIGSADPLIAPMLFVPFIENAFKHSGSKKHHHGIIVSIKITEARKVVFRCRNFIGPVSAKGIVEQGGLGLDLIKQRIQLLYKEDHVLEIKQTNDYFEVLLEINGHD